MFLAVDTVFGQCSVAVIDAEGHTISTDTKTGNREQTQQILPMIDSALQRAGIQLSELSALVFNRGPGAFSGIRINTAVVQALSVAHDIPCVGVSSLQVLAQAAYEQYQLSDCYAVLDARMQQVYCAQYTKNADMMVLVEQNQERLVDYDSALSGEVAMVGNGASLLQAQPNQATYDEIQTDAAILGRLGRLAFLQNGGVSAEQALPVYLRNDAWKTLKQQKAKA